VIDSLRLLRADRSTPIYPARQPLVRYLVCPSFGQRLAVLWRLSDAEAVLLVDEPTEEGTRVVVELPPCGEAPQDHRLGRVASVQQRGQKGYVLRCHFAQAPSPAAVTD
jgi:hypothetical protein